MEPPIIVFHREERLEFINLSLELCVPSDNATSLGDEDGLLVVSLEVLEENMTKLRGHANEPFSTIFGFLQVD